MHSNFCWLTFVFPLLDFWRLPTSDYLALCLYVHLVGMAYTNCVVGCVHDVFGEQRFSFDLAQVQF